MVAKSAKIGLALFLGGMLVIHAFKSWQERRLVTSGSPDFTIFYTAGKILRQGAGPGLYNDQTQLSIQREFAAVARERHAALPFNHPPFEAIAFVPFTLLPYPVAYLVWALLNLVFLGLLPFLLVRQLTSLPRFHPAVWVVSGFAFFPTFASLLQGQDSILLLLIYCLVFVAFKKRAHFLAGACLALGLFKFQLVVPFAFVLLLKRKWRFLSGFVAVAPALVLLSIAVVGWHAALYYPRYLWMLEKTQGRGAIVPATMPNLHGLLDNALAWKAGSLFTNLLVVAISALLILVAARGWDASDGPSQDLSFALTMIVTVLVSYHTLTYDWSLLVLPALIALNHIWAGGQPRFSSQWPILMGVACLAFTPLYWILWRYGHLNLLAVLLLLFAGAVACETFQPKAHADVRA